jgi:flagellar capping protein FliD
MPSGLDDNSIIDQLVAIEQTKVTKIEDQKSKDQVKIDAYSQIQSLLKDMQTKAVDLGQNSSFDLFSSTSTNADAVTIKSSSGSVEGQYDVKVFQLATNEKMISTDGRIVSQKTTLASQGITVGNISIGGVKITVDANDTIQDLRSKINLATDAKGNRLGVTASVIKISDTNYRLVLAAKDTGSAGIEYKDLTGSTLQGLGIIATAGGEKGSSIQMVRSSDDIATAWNALSAGTSIHFEGTDHAGRNVSGTVIKTAGGTIDDFLKSVAAAYGGTVDAATDGTGRLTVTDRTAGASQLTLGTLTLGSTSYAMSVAQAGSEGKGVLSVGRDAYFSVEDIRMSSKSNSVTGFDAGTSFELHAVSAATPVTVALTRDFDAIKNKITGVLESFNSLLVYTQDATKFANPNDKNGKDGDLAGDMTVASIIERVRSAFRRQYDLLGGDLTSFTMIGVKTDSSSGKLSLDEEKFKKACASDFQGVVQLFTTVGVSSDNKAVTLGRNTKETKSGRYEIEEVDPQHLRIRAKGSSLWYTSGQRTGDVVAFADGPVKGLMLSAPQGTISGTVAFSFSKGISAILDEAVADMTDTQNGMVSLRKTSLQDAMGKADDRIARLQERVNKYRDRLVRQFSNMESAISGFQSQSSRIQGTFGATTGA